MWIFTEDGFYSVVEYDPKKDMKPNCVFKTIVKKKGTHVLVRTRVKEHMEALNARLTIDLVIEDQPTADYRYRSVMPRGKWKSYLNTMTDKIDYDSHYKEVVRDAQPANLKGPMYSAMMSVWSTMANMQPGGAWGGYSGGYYGGDTGWYGGGKGKSSGTSSGGSTTKLDDVLADDEFWSKYDKYIPETDGEPITLQGLRDMIDENKSCRLTVDEIHRLDTDAFDVWDAMGPETDVPYQVVLAYIDDELSTLAANNDGDASDDETRTSDKTVDTTA